jgi:hypothetical protein
MAEKLIKISGRVEAVDSSARPEAFLVKARMSKGKGADRGMPAGWKNRHKERKKNGRISKFQTG